MQAHASHTHTITGGHTPGIQDPINNPQISQCVVSLIIHSFIINWRITTDSSRITMLWRLGQIVVVSCTSVSTAGRFFFFFHNAPYSEAQNFVPAASRSSLSLRCVSGSSCMLTPSASSRDLTSPESSSYNRQKEQHNVKILQIENNWFRANKNLLTHILFFYSRAA